MAAKSALYLFLTAWTLAQEECWKRIPGCISVSPLRCCHLADRLWAITCSVGILAEKIKFRLIFAQERGGNLKPFLIGYLVCADLNTVVFPRDLLWANNGIGERWGSVLQSRLLTPSQGHNPAFALSAFLLCIDSWASINNRGNRKPSKTKFLSVKCLLISETFQTT